MKIPFYLILTFSFFSAIKAQKKISFQHLTTENGLSHIFVKDACIDQKGNLWVATNNGLNRFNGKEVETYVTSTHPSLGDDIIEQLVCDSLDRIWIMTSGGKMCLLDGKRRFISVSIKSDNKLISIRRIINGPKGVAILWSGNEFYILKNPSTLQSVDTLSNFHFTTHILYEFDTIRRGDFKQVIKYDETNYIFVTGDAFYNVNLKEFRVVKKYNIPNVRALIKWGKNGLLISEPKSKIPYSLDLGTGEVMHPFKNITSQFLNLLDGDIAFAEQIDFGKYVFTTTQSGLIVYDETTHSISRYVHDIIDPSSISSDEQSKIIKGLDGWVFIICNPQGISYFNVHDIIGSKQTFFDGQKSYDNYISCIYSADNNVFYLGTAKGVIEWNRSNDRTRFIDLKDAKNKITYAEVASIVVDRKGKLWVAKVTDGLCVFDKFGKQIKILKNDPNSKRSLQQRNVNRIIMGPDNFIWTCGRDGLSRINPETYEIDNFENTSLKIFAKRHVVPIWFVDNDHLLISASFYGLFSYNFKNDSLETITAFESYKKNGILDVIMDDDKNIYVGNKSGLYIINKNANVRKLTSEDGLLSDIVEALFKDENGNIWIGNTVGMACYNPKDSSLKAFDERFGLSVYGLNLGAYTKIPNGEIALGTPKGIQYFYPKDLLNKTINLNVFISRIETKNMDTYISTDQHYILNPSDNQVTFHFHSVDFAPHNRTYYQYKLIGNDKNWIISPNSNTARYNLLDPGEYTFEVRVSHDNRTWQDSANKVYLNIATPVSKTWWFRLISLVLGISVTGFILNYFRIQQKLKQKLAIELLENKQKVTESRLQSLRLQMNPHFLFNALNSIQQMILANEDMVATRYLSRFSKLLRSILTHSDKETLSLREEIDILKMYIELEAVRFKDSFNYSVVCDDDIEQDEIKIPTLLIQPFVENAIWHGLMHKEGFRHLTIQFHEKENYLECRVRDNGIGRKKSAEIKNVVGGRKSHTSKGIAVSEERIKTVKNILGYSGQVIFNDLIDDTGNANGTEVILQFPI